MTAPAGETSVPWQGVGRGEGPTGRSPRPLPAVAAAKAIPTLHQQSTRIRVPWNVAEVVRQVRPVLTGYYGHGPLVSPSVPAVLPRGQSLHQTLATCLPLATPFSWGLGESSGCAPIGPSPAKLLSSHTSGGYAALP